MMRAPWHRPAAGFTLIEILVGLLLLSLLVAGAWGGITTAVNAIHSGSEAIERVNRLRVTQQFLRRQLRHAMPVAFARDEGTGEPKLFLGGPERMRFVAPMPGYLSSGGLYVQTLSLTRGKDGHKLSFAFHMFKGLNKDQQEAEDSEPTLLIGGIREGRFLYRGLNDQGQLGEWTPEWEDPGKTPVMVRIDFNMAPELGLVWPVMDIPLMMDVASLPRSARQRLRMPPQRPMPRPGGPGGNRPQPRPDAGARGR